MYNEWCGRNEIITKTKNHIAVTTQFKDRAWLACKSFYEWRMYTENRGVHATCKPFCEWQTHNPNTRQNFANSGSRAVCSLLLGEGVFPHLGKHLSNYSYVISKGKMIVQATAKQRAIGEPLRAS